jgi:UDP-glucuronate 4-epimerase
MKILVTGSAGFIGSHLLAELHFRGHQVLGVDNFSDYYSVDLKKFRIESIHKKNEIMTLDSDIADKGRFLSILREFQPETVIHLAAQPGIRLPIASFSRYSHSNLLGFASVAESICELGIPNFLYASSSSVYGNEAKIPYCEDEKNLNPISYYGGTKLSNEFLAKSLSKLESSRFRGLRFFTVYGPLGRPDMAMMRILNSVTGSSTFELYGDGQLKRDFTYIQDVIESIVLLVQQLTTTPLGFSDVVNVGGGNPHSMNELISIIEEATGTKLRFKESGKISVDVDTTSASTIYLENLINFKPKVSLSQGVKLTLDWIKSPAVLNKIDEWIK